MHIYLLIFVTILWGIGAACIKIALEEINAATFIFFRFSIATLCMMVILAFNKTIRTPLDVVKGIVLGGLTTSFIFFHAMSVRVLPLSLACFLTGVSVVFVLLINFFILKKLPKAMDLLAIVLCLTGLYFITHSKGIVWEWGLFYGLGTAFFMALHTYSMSHFSKNSNIILLNLVQMVVPALFAACILFYKGEGIHLPNQPITWCAILFSAFFASVAAMWLQSYCQQHLSVFVVAVVLLLEPVFATLFSCLFFEETLHISFYVGAFLLLLSILMVNLRLKHM